jgi:hypothetical protein
MKKILKYTGISLLLVILLLIATPFLFKGKIVGLLKKAINDNINAKVDFNENIELSLIRNFPNFSLGINSVSVVGINEFKDDTLFAIKKFSAILDIKSVISGNQIKVIAIRLYEPRILAKVLTNGKANWDITKPSLDTTAEKPADTTTSSFNVKLKRFEIDNADIVFDDEQSNIYAAIKGFDHKLKGDFNQDVFLLSLKNSIQQLTIKMDGISYLNKVNLTFNADIDANMKDMRFAFNKNELKINALAFNFDGWVQMLNDDINMDMKFNTPSTEFKNIISLIPSIYSNDFEKLTSAGRLALAGKVNGVYNDQSYPAFDISLKVEDGMFKYQDMPMSVSNVQIDFNANNQTNSLNGTEINLSKFHIELGKEPFDFTLFAKNLLQDPTFQTSMIGKINLANIETIMPLDEGVKLTGLINSSLQAKGKLSTIENQKYDQFDAAGSLQIEKLIYKAPDLPQPFTLNQLVLNFTPKAVNMPVLDAKVGNSDFVLSGELTNFFAYLFSDGTIKGNLNMSSKLIDANQFLSDDETTTAGQETTTDTTSITAPQIPSNIDFKLTAKLDKLLYTNMDITNLVGAIIIQNGKLNFKQVRLNTLGSTMGLDGYYNSNNIKAPIVDIDFSIQNLDIQKAFATFNTIQKLAPAAENMQGVFNTKFKMNAMLDYYMNPIYDNITASGVIEIPNAKLTKVKVFERTADLLKNERFREPSLSNVRIQFTVDKGRINTLPFDVNVGGQKLTLYGSTGLDQTIDYIGQTIISKSSLGAVNSGANSLLNQLNKQAGTSIKMSDNIPVDIFIKGTFTDPKITTGLAAAGKNEADNIKNQLLDEANKRKAELEAKAKAEADRLKQEAQQKIDQSKAEAEARARAEADRLSREAEEKAKAEQERLKKQAEEEAKRRLKGVIRP